GSVAPEVVAAEDTAFPDTVRPELLDRPRQQQRAAASGQVDVESGGRAALGYGVLGEQVDQGLGLLDRAVDDLVRRIRGDHQILQTPEGLDEATVVRPRLHRFVDRESPVVFVVVAGIGLLTHGCARYRATAHVVAMPGPLW